MAVRGRRTEWTVDVGQIAKLSRALKVASPAVAKGLRAELRTARDMVAANARVRAAAVSSKIPGTVKGVGSVGTLKVEAGGDAAPNAAPFENRGREGTFRHPVFGHEDRWVAQQAHPFLTPALQSQAKAMSARIDAAIEKAVGSL